jgi:CBS-domain-containing membrane protein
MKSFLAVLGVEQASVSHAERIASGLGGFVSILSILIISEWLLHGATYMLIVASMGASAVLLFAVPHGPLSQPWPLVGGHVLSAVIGVLCAMYISNELLAASLAVGLAITVMYYLRCIHPPGGATALAAVVGGEGVHTLGFSYLLTPVLLNVITILIVAVVFNSLFSWRRYPVYWYRHRQKLSREKKRAGFKERAISHEDFVYALSQIDSYIDVTEHDLLNIYDLATEKAQQQTYPPDEIKVGGYYSNGQFGDDWSVRFVVDESHVDDIEKDMIVYKVVAGQNRRTSGYCSRKEFSQWARNQVIRDEDNWKRIDENVDE